MSCLLKPGFWIRPSLLYLMCIYRANFRIFNYAQESIKISMTKDKKENDENNYEIILLLRYIAIKCLT